MLLTKLLPESPGNGVSEFLVEFLSQGCCLRSTRSVNRVPGRGPCRPGVCASRWAAGSHIPASSAGWSPCRPARGFSLSPQSRPATRVRLLLLCRQKSTAWPGRRDLARGAARGNVSLVLTPGRRSETGLELAALQTWLWCVC